MTKERTENELAGWVSTYGLLTSQRIFERFQINLSEEDLVYTLKTPSTFYHRLLKIPLSIVYNGIILEQAGEYQKYAQKMFVDYLLSGESSKTSESPGAMTRESLESQRQILTDLNDAFRKLELEQEKIIVATQASIGKYVKTWQDKMMDLAKIVKRKLALTASEQSVAQALQTLLIEFDVSLSNAAKNYSWSRIEERLGVTLAAESKQIIVDNMGDINRFIQVVDITLAEQSDKILAIGVSSRQYRHDFYEFILRSTELFRLLPEYRIDESQTVINKESLYFDAALGDSAQ